jgi:O-acetyl-ADP-ribose deacetylase (regulator of RNase III)
MLGCFCPCHGCIDNAIHTFAGVQLRLECAEQMERQGHPEETGRAKITKAYNLPSRFVLHTVGPIVSHRLTKTHCEQLKSCYRSCLTLAMEHGLESIAFCCISTGEFHFPNDRAADIAVETVRAFQQQQREHGQKEMKVIFNVFQDYDYQLYQDRLGGR